MTNDMLPVDAVEFDSDKDFIYTKPKVNNSGGKGRNFNSKSKKGLYMSTPLMLTWGINEYVDDQTVSEHMICHYSFQKKNIRRKQQLSF